MTNTKQRRQWIDPSIRRYGTFETVTQDDFCDKRLNGSDGFTFMGQPIVCRDPVDPSGS